LFKSTICHAAADVLLWRNKKISSSVLAAATVVWALLQWLNYHFLTLLCFSFVSCMLLQFVWSNAARTFKRYILFLFANPLPLLQKKKLIVDFYKECWTYLYSTNIVLKVLGIAQKTLDNKCWLIGKSI
jgi:Reticulon